MTVSYTHLDVYKRQHQQTVIITGRGCHRDILELADTVSELRPVKHAFDAGVKAQILSLIHIFITKTIDGHRVVNDQVDR